VIFDHDVDEWIWENCTVFDNQAVHVDCYNLIRNGL
jgi:hypothetical protein